MWNPFSASIEIILWFFFHFLMWYITFIDLCMLKHHYIPGINCTWSRYIILLMYSWIQFANILLRIFASVFIKDTGMMLFFVWFAPVVTATPFMKYKVRVSADKTRKGYWFLPFPDELYGKQLFGTSPMVADLQIRVCLDSRQQSFMYFLPAKWATLVQRGMKSWIPRTERSFVLDSLLKP